MATFDYYSRLFGKPGGRPTATPGTIMRPVAQPGTAPATVAPGGAIRSPELEGLKHSPYSQFMQGLSRPIPYNNLQQQRYNIARGQIQGGTRTALEQMKTFMGGRGFRAGEAGIADAPLTGVATRGQELLSRASTEIATSEAERKQQIDMMNLQRMMGGAQLGLAGEEGIQNRLLQYLALLSGTEQQRWEPYWSGVTSAYGG